MQSKPVSSAKRTRAGRRRPLAVVLVVLAAVAVLATVGTLAVRQGEAEAGTSTDIWAWQLPDLQGDGQTALADFRGKPVVVNFFASWCTACNAELPAFAEISDELRGTVQFVGVDSLETGDPLLLPRRHGIQWWPLVSDVGGSNKNGLQRGIGDGRSMPWTAFYDAQGQFLESHQGAFTEQGLRDEIKQLYQIDTAPA